MPKNLRYLGLDVHTATIAVAVAESDGTVRELGIIRNRPEAVRKLLASSGRSTRFACATKPAPRAIRSTGS